ncbi:hypothetical protein ACO0RG_001777 [Hanseniaspora osmophila]
MPHENTQTLSDPFGDEKQTRTFHSGLKVDTNEEVYEMNKINEGVDKETTVASQKAVATHTPSSKVNERKLLFKIDCCVLSYVCLQYWINYVDRVGFTNAYVTGMKETLNLQGNDFNLINTCFTVGYIVSMIPHNLILLKVPPKVWLSFCTFAWGLLTLGMHGVTSFRQCCVLRFFQAVFESCTFSGTHLILGSWYKEEELPFRSSIFTSSGLIGSLFSGFMQVGIYNSLNGKAGLEGWRWLFLVDSFITIPIAMFSLIYFPDPPSPTSSSSHANETEFAGSNSSSSQSPLGKPSKVNRFYQILNKVSIVHKIFTPEELAYAKHRLPVKDETKTNLNWSTIKRVVGSWHWWMFSTVWALGGLNISFASNSTFALYLANLNYSIKQKNNYPMGIYAVGIVATMGSSLYLTMRKNRHLDVSIFISVVMIVVAIMIRCNPLKPAVMFAAQYIGGVCYAGQSVFFSWANVVCANDLQERAIVLASMNMFSGAVNAWWSILFYSATTSPTYKKGCYAMFGTAVATVAISVIIRILQARENAKKNVINYVDLNETEPAYLENTYDEEEDD